MMERKTRTELMTVASEAGHVAGALYGAGYTLLTAAGITGGPCVGALIMGREVSVGMSAGAILAFILGLIAVGASSWHKRNIERAIDIVRDTDAKWAEMGDPLP